jgi:hypothetical protein
MHCARALRGAHVLICSNLAVATLREETPQGISRAPCVAQSSSHAGAAHRKPPTKSPIKFGTKDRDPCGVSVGKSGARCIALQDVARRTPDRTRA